MLKLPDNIDHKEAIFPRGAFILRKICENYKGGRVIDIGCGNGKITRSLGKIGVNILGIDVDENEIKKAVHSNEYENVQFSCVNVDEVPSREFSGCLLTEVLEHTKEPLNFLREIHRLLCDDGFLILTIPNGYSLKEIFVTAVLVLRNNLIFFNRLVTWYRKVTRRDQMFNDSPHSQHFTLRRIRYLIKESGFIISEEFRFGIWTRFFYYIFCWFPLPFLVCKIERRIEKYMPYYLLEVLGFLCVKKNLG